MNFSRPLKLAIVCAGLIAFVSWVVISKQNVVRRVAKVSSTDVQVTTVQPLASNGQSLQSARGPTIVPNAPVTNALRMLQELRGLPTSKLLSNFKEGDESLILAIYQETPLSNRTTLVWALARIGGDETAKTFIHTLREEFAGKTLIADEGGQRSEEATMEVLVTALGFVASRSETANSFLRSAIDPQFWDGIVGWQSTTGKEINGLLASSAIQGLGLTGREDIEELLNYLKSNLPTDTTVAPHLRRSYAGDLVQAAYYNDLHSKMGNDEFYVWFLDLERDVFDADGSYQNWTKSTAGAEWKGWYLQQLK